MPLHKSGIDIERGKIVDQACDAKVEFVRQDVIQQRRLARAEEASDQSHREWVALSVRAEYAILIAKE